jgi:uncharacterized protein YaiL (DUF2058 family)
LGTKKLKVQFKNAGGSQKRSFYDSRKYSDASKEREEGLSSSSDTKDEQEAEAVDTSHSTVDANDATTAAQEEEKEEDISKERLGADGNESDEEKYYS